METGFDFTQGSITKKLIRFMLRKCDNGGNRIFDVKDTITFISEAENINTSLKKSNHDFKARDAKEFYDDLFNQMVEMYGKLKPVRKFRTGNEAQPKNANVNL